MSVDQLIYYFDLKDKNCTEVPLDVKMTKGPVTDSVCQEVRPTSEI